MTAVPLLPLFPLLLLAAPQARPTTPVPLVDSPYAPGFLPRGEPEKLGARRDALEELVRAARLSRTDALLVIKDGHVLVERTFGAPGTIELMSVTKSVVGLAVGLLLAEKKIASLDAPLSTWFPEWAEGKRARVTLRQLLDQTSGIAHDKGARRLYAQPDMVKYVRESAVTGEPGARFDYNNEAVQLLSAIVARAAGKPVDAYLKERLFTPLGISRFTWSRDAAGNAHTFAGLALEPRDLARIGLLMAAGGKWEGRQLVPEEWVRLSTTASRDEAPWYGLLWWIRRDGDPSATQTAASRREALAKAGVAAVAAAAAVEKLAPLDGKVFPSAAGYWLEAGALLSGDERVALAELARRGTRPFQSRPAPAIGFYGDGWLGQSLLIYPAWKVVAVRLHRECAGGDEAENEAHGFGRFAALVEAAVRPR